MLNLRYLSVADLVGRAGGDPWKSNDSVQSGAPGEINELAHTFRDVGTCADETSDEFIQAQRRFEAAWDRQDGGGHPINDSSEVQRATNTLKLDREQLSRIAVDLGNIAASLSETQKYSATSIEKLDTSLQQIDDAIHAAVVKNGLVVDQDDLAPLVNMAVQDVKDALSEINSARDTYNGELSRAMSSMQADGYMPAAVEDADGDGATTAERASNDSSQYGFHQRAVDEALNASGGPPSAEKNAAAARLRDYAVVLESTANEDAVRLAGERLNDYLMAQQPSGVLRPDPTLGVDPQRRALVRQEWQKQLEVGSPQLPPMTPDEATAWMDKYEAQAKVAAVDSAINGFESHGLSRENATAVVDAISRGVPFSDLAATAGPLSELEQVDGALSDGKHTLPWERFSTPELKTISGLGRGLFAAGGALEAAAALQDIQNGAPPGKTWGGFAGSVGGGWAVGAGAGLAAGSVAGPPGAFIGAICGGLIGGAALKPVGEAVGGYYFDR